MANRNRQQRRERRQERRERRQERKANQQMTVGGFTPQTSQAVSGTPYDSPTGAYQTYQTGLPGGQQAYSQNPIGSAGQQYLDDIVSGRFDGGRSFAEWEAAGGYQGGSQAAAAATPGAEETGGSQRQRRRKGRGLTIRGVRVGRNLSGKEAMKLAATGLGERAIDVALGKGAGIQGSAQRRLDKGQLGTSEQNILGNIFDQGGIPASLDPRSDNLKGLRGLGLQRGQRYFGATGSGEPILGTKAMGGTGGGGGRRGKGGGGGGTAETVPAAEPAVQEDSLIINEPTEETTPDMGGLMFGSTGTGPGAFGFKRRRGSRERNRLLQLGTGQLNRLKLRSALNIRGLTGLL
jgi:hypothetical protein